MKFIRRLLAFLLSMLALSAAVFFVSRLAPGDPLVSYYGERAERMTPQQRAAAEARLGLDEPIPAQYVRWLRNALRGDLGVSYKYKTDVREVIRGRIGNTLLLGGVGFALIFSLALGLGLVCAWFEDRLPDRLLCRLGTVMSCVPEFWMSLLLVLVFAVWLRVLPGSGAYTAGTGGGSVPDRIRHLALPMTAVVAGHLWYYAYMIRNMLLEEVRADYVLPARAKGLGRRRVLLRHCLRNILPSYLSLMAISVPHIMGGTYIVETVFSYPGIGTLSYESARYQDHDLLMALCLLSGAVVILCSMLAQAVNGRIDPRVRTRRAAPGRGERDRG